MKILILTQYFYPETGAPQNRLKALASWLQQNGHEVHVLTGMPNYPALKRFEGYDTYNQMTEVMEGYSVHRVNLFLGGKGFVNRLKTYLSFCVNSWRYGRNTWQKGDFDWVFCESPPLFLSLTAYMLSRRTQSKFWFNVSDLWPESVEKLGLVTNPFLLAPFYWLEKWSYKKADFITGQTQGICKSIEKRTGKSSHWYPNGIAIEELQPSDPNEIPETIAGLLPKKVILYSGNLGYAQGLEVILSAARILKSRDDVVFLLIGDGPEKLKLEKLIEDWNLKNVHFYSSVPRNVLLAIIQKSRASIVPLKDIPLFQGAIPSKVFEPLALGVPVLLGVQGEAKEIFYDKEQACVPFLPENGEDLSRQILWLLQNNTDKLLAVGKKIIEEQFNRDRIHLDLMHHLSDE